MGAVISNPRAQGLDGVLFTASANGAQQEFVAAREGLEDLAYEMLETEAAMLAAFARHQDQVAAAAEKALQQPAQAAPRVLQSVL
jgi:hypothetical protein